MTGSTPSTLLFDETGFELITEPVFVLDGLGRVLLMNAFARGLLLPGSHVPVVGQVAWEIKNLRGGMVTSDMHQLALKMSPQRFRLTFSAPIAGLSAIEWTALKIRRDSVDAIFYHGRTISAQEITAEKTNTITASIFSYSQSAVIISDTTGAILQMSESSKRLFKVTDANTQKLVDLLPEIDLANESLFAPESDQQSKMIVNFTNGRTVSGTGFPCEVVLGRIRLADSVQVAIFVHDLSARERNVREFVSEQISDNFNLGNVSDMMSTIVHEVKQPLSAAMTYIKASTKSLENAGYTGREIAIMESAAQQVLRAGDIIQNMHKMIREETLNRTDEDLNILVEEATLFALVDKSDLGINTFFYLDDVPAMVSVDKIQIQQVIHNLVQNAVDAMQDVPIKKLRISVTQNEHSVSVSVKDTGPGISPTLLDDLFKPFRTTKSTGMGIGLSICRRIIGAHNGEIQALNGDKIGAVITFTLPLKTGTAS